MTKNKKDDNVWNVDALETPTEHSEPVVETPETQEVVEEVQIQPEELIQRVEIEEEDVEHLPASGNTARNTAGSGATVSDAPVIAGFNKTPCCGGGNPSPPNKDVHFLNGVSKVGGNKHTTLMQRRAYLAQLINEKRKQNQ